MLWQEPQDTDPFNRAPLILVAFLKRSRLAQNLSFSTVLSSQLKIHSIELNAAPHQTVSSIVGKLISWLTMSLISSVLEGWNAMGIHPMFKYIAG